MRGFFRLIGAFLVIAGILVLAYAGYSYTNSIFAERAAEARVPGQSTEVAGNVATIPALPTIPATAALMPSPSQPSTPAQPSLTSEPRVTTEPTLETAVGPHGLARGEGADPDRLIIPRLKLDTRIDEATWSVVDENGTPTSEWQIPFDAVAHLSTTPKPGEAGNAVISGHHNLIGPNEFGVGKFAGLWNLNVGDPIYIFDSLGRIFLFRVSNHYILKELGEPLAVREVHAQQIMQDTGVPIATFETCWNGAEAPLSGNTFRWIVVASLIGTVNPIQVPRMVN